MACVTLRQNQQSFIAFIGQSSETNYKKMAKVLAPDSLCSIIQNTVAVMLISDYDVAPLTGNWELTQR